MKRRLPFRVSRPRIDQEVDGELEFHLQMRQRELMAQGLREDEARRAALARFGDLTQARQELLRLGHERERHRPPARWLSEIRQDVVFALRQMTAAPAVTLVAIATLAVGIGATTAIFSAVHSVVLRPLPVPDPTRLVVVGETWRDSRAGNISVGSFMDMAEEQTVFDAVAAAVVESVTLSRDSGAERVLAGRVSASFFDVFRQAPARGRVFVPAEDQPGRNQVVVLSHRLWTSQLAADPEIVGKTIVLDGRPHDVIGVMPASFDFTADSEALWIPIAFTPEQRARRDEHYLDVYARLRPGVTIERASQEMAAIGARLAQRFPQDNADRTIQIQPLLDLLVDDYRTRLFVLLGAVGLVLLIACGNVSNLVLARGAARGRELAVRNALGAGRGRLVRQLFTESLVLGVVSAAVGAAAAHGLLRLLIGLAPAGVPRLEQASIDITALAFAVTLGMTASVLFGSIPAWRAARIDVIASLRESGRGAGEHRVKDVVRSALIAVEVALAVVLLVGAGLLIRSAVEMRRVAPGFNPSGVYSARLTLPASRTTAESLTQTAQDIEAAVTALPGVRVAAISTAVPGFGSFFNGIVPEGETRESRNAREARSRFVSPGFFRAMELPIVRGRSFDDRDRAGAPLVMIVNQSLAERLFPGADPVGRRAFCCNEHPKTIVGVAADVRARGPARPVESEFYLPIAQVDDVAWGWTRRNVFVVARTDGDAAMLRPAVRQAVSSVDPGIPLFSPMTMDERMARTVQTERFNTMLLAILGGVGILLAAVGIYGVISYFAAQRAPEIGIRLALGATRETVLRLVAGQAAAPVAAGVVIGGTGALFASQVLATQLVNVTPTDPLTFAAGVLVLAVVASLAALIPARRAAALDPAQIFRSR
ncbi:MAG: ADOP family duplicated permease [Acidobacteriota bacterium]